MTTATAQRVWPYVDTHTLRFDDNTLAADGGQQPQHCSWVMLLPQGTYQHPTYGEIDLSRSTLAEIKRNFDERARGIDIALDYDHRASDGDSKAPGWIQEVRLCDAGTSPRGVVADAPAGLWGLIQWTELGLHDVQGHIYRYISAEYKPEYHNDMTGRTYHNVLLGATLTNRPFMKNMPAIALSEQVSTRPWSDVDKASLPNSAFLDPANRRLPIYEGTGPKDAKGRYTQRGKLNINGLHAANAAVHGAHTGKSMSGLPAGTTKKIERLLARYGGESEGEGKMAEETDALDEQELLTEPEAEVEQFADNGDAADDEGEEYDEADGDGPDGDEEDDNDFDAESDTHGQMTVRGHAHGKFGRHGHADDADHSDAPLAKQTAADKGKGKQMSEATDGGALTLAERRELAEARRVLAEYRAKEQVRDLSADLPEGIKLSPVARQKLTAFLTTTAVTLSETGRNEALETVRLLLSERALVDTRPVGAAAGHHVNEMEDVTRRTFASSEERGQAFAEMVAQREYQISLAELREKAGKRDADAQDKLQRVIRMAVEEATAAK